MRGSDEFVPAFERNLCLRMLAPKVDERVSGNDPHGTMYHVPNMGTSVCGCFFGYSRRRAYRLLLQPQALTRWRVSTECAAAALVFVYLSSVFCLLALTASANSIELLSSARACHFAGWPTFNLWS